MTDSGPAALGTRIRKWREAQGLTRTEVARGLHMNGHSAVTLVTDWESGKCFPSYWSLLELARFFKVTLEELTDFNPME